MKELTVWLRPNLEVARRLSGYYANRLHFGQRFALLFVGSSKG